MRTIACDYIFLGGNDESTLPCLAKCQNSKSSSSERRLGSSSKGGSKRHTLLGNKAFCLQIRSGTEHS
eukprot:12928515-Prorocentrum_lima.AAC.1